MHLVPFVLMQFSMATLAMNRPMRQSLHPQLSAPPPDVVVRCEPSRNARFVPLPILQLRGGGGLASQTADLLISVLVLVAVSAAAQYGSPMLAAVFATAPTGVPLSLWLVHRAAKSGDASLETFLLACTKGTAALACFCFGGLILTRLSFSPSLASLLLVGYGSWAVTWALLRHI